MPRPRQKMTKFQTIGGETSCSFDLFTTLTANLFGFNIVSMFTYCSVDIKYLRSVFTITELSGLSWELSWC